jgi:hypothetical protein
MPEIAAPHLDPVLEEHRHALAPSAGTIDKPHPPFTDWRLIFQPRADGMEIVPSFGDDCPLDRQGNRIGLLHARAD